MPEQMSGSRRLAAATGLCLAVAGITALDAGHTFGGVYSGKRVLTKGSTSLTCPAEDDVLVTTTRLGTFGISSTKQS